MRFPKMLVALSTTLLLAGAQVAAAQDPVRVEVSTPATASTTTVWYADPFWLGIGGVAVLIIIILAVMASRSEGKTTTTVVR